MPFARAGDIDIYHEFEGEGPRVLVISGTGGDLRRRPGLASVLGDRFTTLSYDQRGLGQTSIPDGPYSMAGYAQDAVALLDAVGWDRCMVVGTSFGGDGRTGVRRAVPRACREAGPQLHVERWRRQALVPPARAAGA